MRKLVFLLLVSVLIFGITSSVGGFAFKNGEFLKKSACDKPLEYRMGSIDARFNLSEDKIKSYLEGAEAIWEKPTARNLFTYSGTAELKVELIFDKKQLLNNEINNLDEQLKQGKGDLEAGKREYESQAANFEARLEEFNREVASWNSQGGAPAEEYGRLIARQNDLQAESEKLNNIARELNLSANQYNSKVGTLNKRIREFNDDLSRRPEEGLFDGKTNTIEIYFVPNENELVHTLAHEFGHSIGLEHLDQNTSSIMFPYSSDSLTATSEDIEAVTFVCREKNFVEAMKDNYSYLFERLQKEAL